MFQLSWTRHLLIIRFDIFSAFIGLLVMLALFPIPVYLSKLMSDIQRKKMEIVRYQLD